MGSIAAFVCQLCHGVHQDSHSLTPCSGHMHPASGVSIPAGVADGDCKHYAYNCSLSNQQVGLVGVLLATTRPASVITGPPYL